MKNRYDHHEKIVVPARSEDLGAHEQAIECCAGRSF